MTELGVSDLGTAVAWWADALGRPPALNGDFALFNVNGGRVALKKSAKPGGTTVHFEADELPPGEVKVSEEGYRRVKRIDPDGNVLVVFAWTK